MSDTLNETDARELDRAIGERLFGWKWVARAGKRYLVNPERVLADNETWATGDEPFWEGSDIFLPDYASKIEYAWRVVEEMRRRGFNFAINDRHGCFLSKEYWVEFATADYGVGAQCWGADVSEAICGAALKALDDRKRVSE